MEAFAACFAQFDRWHGSISEPSAYQTTELNGVSKPSKDDNPIRRERTSQKNVTG